MDFELFKLVNQFAKPVTPGRHLNAGTEQVRTVTVRLAVALPLVRWGIAGKKAALLALVSLALALLIAQAIGYAYFRDRPLRFARSESAG